MFVDYTKTPPNHINEAGVLFWLQKSLTEWARREDIHGTSLPTVYCWLAKTPDGTLTYLLMDGESVVMETQSYEAVAVRIDMMKANIR